ncbi:hypothetical protein Rin_00008860 [Candidatus Regiella insecticola 5.15]|uniref:Uncharacterized protein n=1 Tax=Candidatus Regiella insecticola 5.15 TaxID=1005043 RepID=G2GYM6_9ENTR|nr:hypothetical protein [Candidatus Regiella insecticola]EGY29154.1 hypothetical protein Rin_00008860 [Candidatus Regiella insecticola 5.15]
MRAMVRSQQRGGFKGEEYIRNRSSLCEDYTHRATQDPCHAVGFERGLVNKEKVLMPKRYNNDPIVFIRFSSSASGSQSRLWLDKERTRNGCN